MDVGGAHTCYSTHSSVICNGRNNRSQATVPPSVSSGAYYMSLGDEHSCAITLSGTLICWGNNTHGQVDVSVDNQVLDVSLGIAHTCIMSEYMKVICYGDNTYGQLVIRDKESEVRKWEEYNKKKNRKRYEDWKKGELLYESSTEEDEGEGDNDFDAIGIIEKKVDLEIHDDIASDYDESGASVVNTNTVDLGIDYDIAYDLLELDLQEHDYNKNKKEDSSELIYKFKKSNNNNKDYYIFKGNNGKINENKSPSTDNEKSNINNNVAAGGNINGVNKRQSMDTSIKKLYTKKPNIVQKIPKNSSHFPNLTQYSLFLQVSAGGHHSCILKGLGTVECIGSNLFGQSDPPVLQDLTYISFVTSGLGHSCWLDNHSMIACWGWNIFHQLVTLTQPKIEAVSVAAGEQHTCASDKQERVYCWGRYYDNGGAVVYQS